MVNVGEVKLGIAPNAVGLVSKTSGGGSLAVESLRGTLKMDLLNQDAPLVAAARQAVIPTRVAVFLFSWFLFGFLHHICANIERGEVFSEKNLRLIRNIGWTLILYSLVGLAVRLWASWVIDRYLTDHVLLSGLEGVSREGKLEYAFSSGQFASGGGLLTGLLVLVLCEAFRQGLALKAENDLTV